MSAVARYSDYDYFAWFYNKYWGRRCSELVLPVLDRLLLKHLAQGDHILDLCCGTGQVAEELTGRGYRVTGIDGSAEMIRYARENAPEAEFMVADARFFDLPQAFDAVISTSDSLNHVMSLDELESVFRNVYSVLNPGGLFLFDLNCEQTYEARDRGGSSIVGPDHVCIVRGKYRPRDKVGKFDITTFRLVGEWERRDITLFQKCHSERRVQRTLRVAGFTDIRTYDMQRELVTKLEVPSTVFACGKPGANIHAKAA